jgi:predicted  nucleic acid-binding Zn-ribbon protein
VGPKMPGMDRFRSSSSNKAEEELASIHDEIDVVNKKIDEISNRVKKLEEDHIRLVTRLDKMDGGLINEAQVLFDSVNEMGKQNSNEIDILKRVMDVAQRRLVILEANMKELGK